MLCELKLCAQTSRSSHTLTPPATSSNPSLLCRKVRQTRLQNRTNRQQDSAMRSGYRQQVSTPRRLIQVLPFVLLHVGHRVKVCGGASPSVRCHQHTPTQLREFLIGKMASPTGPHTADGMLLMCISFSCVDGLSKHMILFLNPARWLLDALLIRCKSQVDVHTTEAKINIGARIGSSLAARLARVSSPLRLKLLASASGRRQDPCPRTLTGDADASIRACGARHGTRCPATVNQLLRAVSRIGSELSLLPVIRG